MMYIKVLTWIAMAALVGFFLLVWLRSLIRIYFEEKRAHLEKMISENPNPSTQNGE